MNDPIRLLQPERFNDEPIYCEAPHSDDDVIYSGSEDEAYDSPTDRRNRYEEQAQRFADGKPLFLLSASLRGPFDRKLGWVNPWRSQSGIAMSTKRKRPARAKKSTVSVSIPETVQSLKSNVAHDDSILRVEDWRNRVLAELDVNITSPKSTQLSKPVASQPISIQQTLANAASSSSSLSPPPSSPVAYEELTNEPQHESGDSSEEAGQSPEQHVNPSVTPARSSVSLHLNKPDLPPSLLPLDVVDLSPRAIKLYEESFMTSLALTQQSESNVEGSQPESPLQSRSGGATLLVETPVAAGPLPDQDGTRHSLHTDGSFRYRRPRRATRRSSRLSELASSKKDQNGGQRRGRQRSSGPAGSVKSTRSREAKSAQAESARVQDKEEVREQIVVSGQTVMDDEMVVQDEVDVQEEIVVQVGVFPHDEMPVQEEIVVSRYEMVQTEEFAKTAELTEQCMVTPDKAMSCPEGPTSVVPQDALGASSPTTFSNIVPVEVDMEEAGPEQLKDRQSTPHEPELPHSEQHVEIDPSQTPSQIDGVTLVAPASSSSGGASIGCFSTEKASQDETSALLGFPKRLLWPTKSEPFGLNPQTAPLSPTPFTLRIRSSAEPPACSSQQELETLRKAATVAFVGLKAIQEALEGVSSEPEVPNMALKSERPSPTPPPVLAPEQDQSPWVSDALPLPPRVVTLLSNDESVLVHSPQAQSPWARGDSQIVAPKASRVVLLSSPVDSAPLLQTTETPPLPQEVHDTSSQIILTHPSTPEFKKSGLPTPEFTISSKSHRKLSTPSPLPAAKRRRISTDEESETRLPSTQHLVEAAISNPWIFLSKQQITQWPKSAGSSQGPKKPKKSVRFAPLPGDPIPPSMDPDGVTAAASSSYGAELSNTTPNNISNNKNKKEDYIVRPRAASPPPSILMTEPLPSANEKFGKHFAKVTAKRQIGIRTTPSSSFTTTTPHLLRSQRKTPHLLPSESQQTCPSPAVDAMAQAFITADSYLAPPSHQQSASSLSSDRITDDGTVQLDIEAMVNGGTTDGSSIIEPQPREQEQEQSPFRGEDLFIMQHQQPQQEAAEEIDDVSAVLDNLDDFLGQSWDLDADLARVRAEDKSRRGESSRSSWAGGGMDMDLDLDLIG
ncbi:hypothetical protein QBC38DRAFT_480500 [Podospora fimiseda]|uniref:Protamine P1 n=1 Tax=Podospora fimiseda TaxID=252190 RepID=A0AAN7BND5_9PEZI|nr:hypothetical protein QBC38DRAFT_480500 [Podospora fimiseda]